MATSQNPNRPHRRHLGDRAGIGAAPPPDDPSEHELHENAIDLDRPWSRDAMAAYVRQVVDAMPRLSEGQRAHLALLMRGSLSPEDEATPDIETDKHRWREAA